MPTLTTITITSAQVLTPGEAMRILRCGAKLLATLRELHPDLVAYTNGKQGRRARYRYSRTAVLRQAGIKAGDVAP